VEQNENSREWYALRVRSRHEFVTYNELSRKGIEAYLPTIKKWSQWKDRKKLVEFPLFSGYIFANIDINSQEYYNTLKTKGAVNILSLEGGRPAPVPSDEIDSLRILVGSGEKLDIYPNITEGTKVMVTKGLLKGARGVLTRKETHCVFSVDIILLGKSVGVKVLADELETI
jgi:transcription antitermination factor NusG